MNGNIAQFSLSFPFLLWYNAHKATPQHMHGPAGHQRGLTYSRLGGIVSWKIIVPAASCWPVSSLPGPYGIGSLGGPSRRFVDFLAEAGQHYWQILPLVPPGDGSSPYMSPSAFAGNPYLIDLDELAAEGLLTPQELDGARWPDPDRVDYDHLAQTRIPLLQKAWERSQTAHLQSDAPDLPWLEDYCTFASLHDRYQAPFWQWPEDAPPPEPGGD